MSELKIEKSDATLKEMYSIRSTIDVEAKKENDSTEYVSSHGVQHDKQSSVTTSASVDEVLLDMSKNVITKEDVEKVLDLKFVKPSINKRSLQVQRSTVDDMKLSYHNLGAFQAYERAKTQRIRDAAMKKYGLVSKDIPLSLTKDRDSTSLSNKQRFGAHKNPIINSKCDHANKSCHISKKTRRLAEVLISNIEAIKFFAGGPCDICGRDSCDGFNHFPDAPPVEQVTQVRKSDLTLSDSKINETSMKKSVSILVDEAYDVPFDVKTLPSEPAFAPYNSKIDVDTVFVNIQDANKVSSDLLAKDAVSSNHSDGIIQFPSTFTIHFQHIDLKADGLDMIEYSNRATRGFRLNYTFLMYKETVEFETFVQGISIKIDEVRVHNFSMNPIIYQYLRHCCIHVELDDIPLNLKRKGKFLGNCDICFIKLLNAVDKTQKLKLLITDEERIAFITNGRASEFGDLFLEVTLAADKDHINQLAKNLYVKRSPIDVMGTGSCTDFLERVDSPLSLTRSKLDLISDARLQLMQGFEQIRLKSEDSIALTAFEKGLITEGENKAFYDALQLVLVRNKALRTRQSEIDTELNDRAEWMHEELKWRLTLQEHAILSGKDPESIRWRQWRDENTSDVRFRTIMDEEIEYEPVVIITVQHLELLPISQVMLDESIKLIYIEYSFLTHTGLELETKSLPKTAEGIIVYNFVKRFEIGIHKDNIDTQVLAEHIKANQSIKFTAVHEPIEDPEELQTCLALGSCEINLFNLAQHVSNTREEVYPLKNAKTGAQDIGHLKIRFDGVRAMRTVALTLLAPNAFKIYR